MKRVKDGEEAQDMRMRDKALKEMALKAVLGGSSSSYLLKDLT